jgi:hypothetical protein
MSIMQNYVFPVNNLNDEAKKHQFYITFCKLLCDLETIYIVQSGIMGHPEDAVIAAKNDTIPVPVEY